jgi:hypothetical protein
MFHTYVQEYISNVSVVLVLCCSKCFYVSSVLSGYYIGFTYML